MAVDGYMAIVFKVQKVSGFIRRSLSEGGFKVQSFGLERLLAASRALHAWHRLPRATARLPGSRFKVSGSLYAWHRLPHTAY